MWTSFRGIREVAPDFGLLWEKLDLRDEEKEKVPRLPSTSCDTRNSKGP